MRHLRIKAKDPEKVETIYHCMSRTVDGAMLLDTREKEIFRKMLHRVADFSGVEVLTYCIMDNHFHLLVRVFKAGPVSDAELVRRFGVLYPNPTKYQMAVAEDIARILAAGGEQAEALRKQLLRRMYDVSEFMKNLKQRFSIWYNKTQDRFGPLWSDRFKSVLIQPGSGALKTVAAYIELNPVRAGMVNDPKDYRFCGYAEAVAGDKEAGEGLRKVAGSYADESLASVLKGYRMMLFGKGASAVSGASKFDRKQALKVIEAGGSLPIWALLRCRVRYFTDGAILGSREFILAHLQEWQKAHPLKKKAAAQPRPMRADRTGELAVMHDFRLLDYS